MKAVVIVNPCARGGQAASRRRDTVTRRLNNIEGVTSVEWIETQHPGHARPLAQEAAQQEAAYVVAAGGDGTISEVINGIMHATVDKPDRPTLGELPWGTVNDFYVALKAAARIRRASNAE